MKTLTKGLAAGAIAALTSTAALAEGGVIRFGHDNKTDPFENPAHACTAVFSNIVTADTNGSVKVEVFGSNQLGSAAEHVQQLRDGLPGYWRFFCGHKFPAAHRRSGGF